MCFHRGADQVTDNLQLAYMIRELLKYQQNNFTYVAFCLIQQTVKYIREIMKSFISVYILALFLGLVESIVYLCYTSSKDHLFLKKVCKDLYIQLFMVNCY